MFPALLIGTPVLLASGLAHVQTPNPDDYVARFEHAMTVLDRNDFEVAAAAFEAAGRLEPDAPVWRVHRAVALLHTGAIDRARAFAADALRRGYPTTDLAAIDARLLPVSPLAADLSPEHKGTVLRLGPEAVPGGRDVTIGNDLVVVAGTAWNLVSGKLEAVQRMYDKRVIAYRIHPDDTREPVYGPMHVGRWDHVDGRLLEEPWSGQAGEAKVRYEHVHGYSMAAARRGARSGLWVEGSGGQGDPRFFEG